MDSSRTEVSSGASSNLLRLTQLAELQPPCRYIPIDLPSSPEQQHPTAAGADDRTCGLFMGQLPANISTDDITLILQALARRSGVCLTIKDVGVFEDRRSCAFIQINASALPAIVAYHRRIVKDGNGLWYADNEATLEGMQRLLAAIHKEWSTRDGRLGSLPPKQPIVIEEITTHQRRGDAQSRRGGGGPSLGSAVLGGQFMPIPLSVSLPLLSHIPAAAPAVANVSALISHPHDITGGVSGTVAINSLVASAQAAPLARMRCIRCAGLCQSVTTPTDCPLACDVCTRKLHLAGEPSHICQSCLTVGCSNCVATLFIPMIV